MATVVWKTSVKRSSSGTTIPVLAREAGMNDEYGGTVGSSLPQQWIRVEAVREDALIRGMLDGDALAFGADQWIEIHRHGA